MRISEVIADLATVIYNEGDKVLPEDVIISYKYGRLNIE